MLSVIEYRVENKYLVSDTDLTLLAGRLKSAVPHDVHQTGDSYYIRSLYFDDIYDNCMEENDAGVDQRQKFRIRLYNPQQDTVHLEIKEKYHGLTKKTACNLTRTECRQIMDGTFPFCIDQRAPLNALQLRRRSFLMQPKVIISYERTAFVYPSGNVRITFDRNITASSYCSEFLSSSVPGATPILPAGMHVLEVKYDEFLPDFIANLLELGTLQQTAFSKYYLGRLAVQGEFVIDR